MTRRFIASTAQLLASSLVSPPSCKAASRLTSSTPRGCKRFFPVRAKSPPGDFTSLSGRIPVSLLAVQARLVHNQMVVGFAFDLEQQKRIC